ncbi:MAG TPA: hypothetical protein VMZ91_03980 [Candidatus Paceibacterota bacterium]|nr:hypothetical protein [Candidatus Paceibacterota bacterium]
MKNKPLKHGFFKVPHETFDNKEFLKLENNSQFLYVVLCKLSNRYEDESGWFYRSINELANDCQKSTRWVSESKKELFEHGFIYLRKDYDETGKGRRKDFFKLNGFKFKEIVEKD